MTEAQRLAAKRLIEKAQSFVNTIKTKPCTDCGHTFPPICMDFDHVRGKKVDSVSRMAGRGRGLKSNQLKTEIAKCDLVCANCHRIRTALRGYTN